MNDTESINRSAIILLGAIALAIGLILMGWNSLKPTFGSVAVSSEYFATTTTSVLSGTFANNTVIKSGYGTLGSIVITGANTGVIQLIDTTTTNVNLRTGQSATTTIVLAELPTNLVAGTYTFDVQFTRGLLLTSLSGIIPTSTITYR